MARADPVTWHFVRYRLTDPVSGLDNWRAEAFGLLVAERFYPDLVVCCRGIGSDAYGVLRHCLNRAWEGLRIPTAHHPRQISDRDLQVIASCIPDNRLEGLAGARAVAAGTICLHLTRFLRSGDRNDIARLAGAAYAGVAGDLEADELSDCEIWPNSIPFDEMPAYDALISDAPGVQVELQRQNEDLLFVESLGGSHEERCNAALRRAFATDCRRVV